MNDISTIPTPLLRGPVPLSHLFLNSFVRGGDAVIDATCGNGHDTLLLAGLVGAEGHVWGFDVQQEAIDETGRRGADAGLTDRLTLLRTGHENMAQHVTGPVRAVLFNLGYRPGGDRSIITHPESTSAALGQSLELLGSGGVVIVTVYPGHSGGADERSCVEQWAATLNPRRFHSWRMGQTNVSSDAPYLMLVQKTV